MEWHHSVTCRKEYEIGVFYSVTTVSADEIGHWIDMEQYSYHIYQEHAWLFMNTPHCHFFWQVTNHGWKKISCPMYQMSKRIWSVSYTFCILWSSDQVILSRVSGCVFYMWTYLKSMRHLKWRLRISLVQVFCAHCLHYLWGGFITP